MRGSDLVDCSPMLWTDNGTRRCMRDVVVDCAPTRLHLPRSLPERHRLHHSLRRSRQLLLRPSRPHVGLDTLERARRRRRQQ